MSEIGMSGVQKEVSVAMDRLSERAGHLIELMGPLEDMLTPVLSTDKAEPRPQTAVAKLNAPLAQAIEATCYRIDEAVSRIESMIQRSEL